MANVYVLAALGALALEEQRKADERRRNEKFNVKIIDKGLSNYYNKFSTATDYPDERCSKCHEKIESNVFWVSSLDDLKIFRHLECAYPNTVVRTKLTTSNYNYRKLQRSLYNIKTGNHYKNGNFYHIVDSNIRCLKPVVTKCCNNLSYKKGYDLVKTGKILGLTIKQKKCRLCDRNFSYRKIIICNF